MKIITIPSSLMSSNMYLVIEDNHAIVIDPGESLTIEKAIDQNGLILDKILLTHEHCDHVYGASRLREKYNTPIIVSKKCNDNLKDERKNFSRYFNALVSVQTKLKTGCCNVSSFQLNADITFENDYEIQWCNHNIYFKSTPGHSQGSVCILFDEAVLFSGDSLLWGEKTNTRFIGGSKKEYLQNTKPWFFTLSEKTVVYSGHLKSFILGERLKTKIC